MATIAELLQIMQIIKMKADRWIGAVGLRALAEMH